MEILAFSLCATLVLLGALWVVTLSNLFRAALSLGLVLLGIAGLFIVLQAEFLAFVQVLVYVGAILTIVVFAIMLTAKLHTAPLVPASRPRLPAAAASLGLFVLLTASTHTLVWPRTQAMTAAVTLSALGQELVKTLVLPFEVISLIFVGAMVGAIALATQHHRSS